ncbi:TldD/PmbA family protein [Candidatus Woesearchaeota archaeon]|nr:TldD/PmbA family protein [Candidatus Woesearchaeota archaeon]
MDETGTRQLFKKLSKVSDDTIVALSKSCVQHAKISNNKVSVLKSWETYNTEIFAALGKRVVSCSLQQADADIDAIVRQVITLAKASAENHDYYGIAKGPFKYQKIKDLYDKRVSALVPKLGDIAERGIHAALANGASRVAGVLELTETEHLLLTSGDTDVNEKGSTLYFSLRAFTDKDASGHDLAVSRTLKNWKFEQAARKAAEIAVMARNPKEGSFGKFDILFEPLPFANLLEMVGNAASMFNVEAGFSFFGGSVNKKVASDIVTMHDTGIIYNGLASSICDAEGVPSKKTAIIEHGIFKNYLHNTSTARKYGTVTTANAGLIAPHPRNIILAPGRESQKGLLGQIKKGIYVTNVWYTRSQNMTTGDFSTIPRDGIFYVEDGKIKHPIKNIRISENMLHILQSIQAIANDGKQIRGWEVENPVVTPSVLVKGLNITRPLEL